MSRDPTIPTAAIAEADSLRVLLVEDVASTAAVVMAALRAAGMVAAHAESGAAALRMHDSFQADVILVDLGLPDMNGLELVARFTASGRRGVIVLTASGAEADRVRGLETGADDYVVKPVSLPELVARVRAVHRRLRPPGATGEEAFHLLLDHSRRQLQAPSGREAPLTEAEYLALVALAAAGSAGLTREEISLAALRRAAHMDDRSVDQLILKLRRKLSDLGASPRTILSMRGKGYLISEPGALRSTAG
jgi:two-component system OmpR family response regulator